jgi:hypothetical protein
MSSPQSSDHAAISPQAARATSVPAPRWISTPYCTVNLSQVCRIEYHRRDVSRDEICGFDLHMVDGTVITLYHGDAGFERVAAELSEQGVVLALGPATSE